MFKKKQFLKDIKKDEIINDIYVVKFKKPVEPYKNGYKFELRLGDSSKEVMYKYWGPAEEAKAKLLYDMIKPDDVVHITGRVGEWNSILEISANEENTIKVVSKGEYNPRDFVKVSAKDPDRMRSDLVQYVQSVKNPELKMLLEYFFLDKAFMERFSVAPAAMYIHHGWIHGLIEHTLSVCQICADIMKVHANLDRDYVITGALLHDIGKIEEFEVTTSIRIRGKGILLGHVTIAVEMLIHAMDRLCIGEETRTKVLHMMITHMGDYGSNRSPAFPEAMLVFHADQLDNRMTQMTDLKKNSQTEDDFIYHKDFGNIYLK
jgi:3'-5' exoribonuclease